ncbi:MAG: hypothetical protein EOM26_11775 [Alphaproteobacteria bacterium]|nr:hypothetical protein [Alphaproteobacteria bacterium]
MPKNHAALQSEARDEKGYDLAALAESDYSPDDLRRKGFSLNALIVMREAGQNFLAGIPAIPAYLLDGADWAAEKLGRDLYDGSAGPTAQDWILRNGIQSLDPIGWMTGKAEVVTPGDRKLAEGTETALAVASLAAGGAAAISKLPQAGARLGPVLTKAAGATDDAARAGGALARGGRALYEANKATVNAVTKPLGVIPGARPVAKAGIYGAEALAVDNATGSHGANLAVDFADGVIPNGTLRQEAFNTLVTDPRKYDLVGDHGNRAAEERTETPLETDRLGFEDLEDFGDAASDFWKNLPEIAKIGIPVILLGGFLMRGGLLAGTILGASLTALTFGLFSADATAATHGNEARGFLDRLGGILNRTFSRAQSGEPTPGISGKRPLASGRKSPETPNTYTGPSTPSSG